MSTHATLSNSRTTPTLNSTTIFLQSYKALCGCVVKQIRTMKRPSSTEYLDALKESKEDKICVSMCVVYSKKVMSKPIPFLTFLQNVNS